MEYLLAADHVSKKFGKYTALNDLSIAVPQGSVFGLLGPNGAGKTTLIRIINQITAPDEGTVTLGGEPLQQKHIVNIGYMPEERGLYKSMKVGEQLLYLAQLKGMSRKDAKEQSEYWFSRLGISGWWDKKIQELSKGQAQKVQFIVTVLHRPKLLIFDEPFSGFDPINANLIKDEILKLRDDGATIIFSTHRMESVEAMCDHIALIHKSNKILDGNLAEIKRNYRSNTYEIGLETAEDTHDARQHLNAAVMQTMPEKWEVTAATFRTIHDHDLKWTVQMPEESSANDLLRYLTTKGMVNHFVEVIPSVNEIFIQTISSSN